jgi:Holliday junction resolvase RusA-like endonuclease
MAGVPEQEVPAAIVPPARDLFPGSRTADPPFMVPDEPGVITFTVPGDPVPFARAGGGRTVFRFTPAKQRNYMALVKDLGARAFGNHVPLQGPVEMTLTAIFLMPASWSIKRRMAPASKWKTSRPDADNLAKIVKDALNTIVWRDDAQVVRLVVEKVHGDRPRLEVKIRDLTRAPLQ